MLLKTYRGPDLATALRRIRAELGPEALVLGTTERPGRLGLPVVEVTVAASRPQSPITAKDEIGGLSQILAASRSTTDTPSRSSTDSNRLPHAAVERTLNTLVASGVSRDLARRFAQMERKDDGRSTRAVLERTTRNIGRGLPFSKLPTEARCLFIFGPPGSGKTTTAAKFAARAALGRRPAVFGVADGERIGGFEQAQIYSRHIGSRAECIRGGDELRRLVEQNGKNGLVVVDTCGIGRGDDERIRELLELRFRIPDATAALLIPSGLHRDEAVRVLDRFEVLEPNCVGLSRVDDGSRPGELVTALAARKIPLAFFTNGHTVPDDLQNASPGALTSLLMEAGRNSRPQTETHA